MMELPVNMTCIADAVAAKIEKYSDAGVSIADSYPVTACCFLCDMKLPRGTTYYVGVLRVCADCAQVCLAESIVEEAS